MGGDGIHICTTFRIVELRKFLILTEDGGFEKQILCNLTKEKKLVKTAKKLLTTN